MAADDVQCCRVAVLYVFALGSVGYTLGAWAALQSALSNLEAVWIPAAS